MVQSDSSKVVALFAGGPPPFKHGCCDNNTLMGYSRQLYKCCNVSTSDC